MLKETRTYTDYNGNERTEDFYFNLSKAELMKMMMTSDGDLVEWLEKITKAKDKKKIAGLFEEIIQKAYGVKSEDGKRFIKNDKVLAEFMESPVYSDIYMELATDDVKAINFIKGIMPSEIAKQINNEGKLIEQQSN